LTALKPVASSGAERVVSPTLGSQVRTLRRERGVRQFELATQAGISRSYLCDIERGRVGTPSLAVLDGLAAALDTSRIDLLRAAGVVEVSDGDIADQRMQRLVAVIRDLSDDGQRSIDRFARFLHAEEHRWVQQPIPDDRVDESDYDNDDPLFRGVEKD
jgi:transcriptional regulator with XRE-family HTH domain